METESISIETQGDQCADDAALEREAKRIALSDPSAAERILSQLIAHTPGKLRLLRPYARLLMRQGKGQAAQPIWERIGAAAPDDPEPHMALARIHYRSERYVQALDCLDAVIKVQSHHAEALRLRSVVSQAAIGLIAIGITSSHEDTRDLHKQLTDRLSEHPDFLRIKEYFESDKCEPQKSKDLELVPDQDYLLSLASELSDAGKWLAYVETVEELIADHSTSVPAISEHVAALQRLANGADAELSKRAGRLLLVCDGVQTLDDGRHPPKESNGDAWDTSTEEELAAILNRLKKEDIQEHPSVLSESEQTALALMRRDPLLAQPLSQFFQRLGFKDKALEVYRFLEPRDLDELGWTAAVELAARVGSFLLALEFARNALAVASNPFSLVANLVRCFPQDRLENLVSLWRLLPDYSHSLRARAQVVRLLYAGAADSALLEETMGMLETSRPLRDIPASDVRHFLEIVRRLTKSAIRGNLGAQLVSHETILSTEPPSVLRSWTFGMLALAKPDMAAALTHFEGALQSESRLPHLDLAAEIAHVHARYHRYRDAHMMAAKISNGNVLTSEQRAYLERVQTIMKLCGPQASFYPECLVDLIFEELELAPLDYTPQLNHIVTVVTSLDQGGSERQTVTVLGKMALDPRVASIALAVRSTDSEQKTFFLPVVSKMPVKLLLYGKHWRVKSLVHEQLRELEGRDRLIQAIDLLPHGMREDVIRLTRLFLDERPQAVHIRQDLYAAALACALAGVPRFLVHRGSLSPDLWGYNELQAHQHLRPMRHVYRRLLEGQNFRIVNNSRQGSETDRSWTGCRNTSRFAVVHNAYDFELLGLSAGRNSELRASLGIAEADLVVGTAFRFVPVKRPMLWIETAHRVLEQLPNAHFLIIGDGPLMEAVRNYAEMNRFSERLHLPGRVADVGPWYRAMDINLLTSEREGLPNVLIEGQHFGVPVVSANVGGAEETIRSGVTGYLLPPDAGPEVFAQAILQTAVDSTWMARAKGCAPEFVHTKFSAERTVDQLLHHLGIVP